MKIVPLHKDDLTHEDSTPAPSFSLEAFREFLTQKLRLVLDTLLVWGDGAVKVLNVSIETLNQFKEEIAAYFFDYKRMCMPLGY